MASSSCVHGFNLPSGFKFLPTDQELLGYYLLNKVLGKQFKFGGPRLNQGEDLYIFTELKKVSNNGSNVARTTGSGTWKGDTSGSEVYVSEDNKKILGSWKRFHYKPNEPTENGSWIMIEYKLDDSLIPKSCKGSDLVLCGIRKDRKRKLVEDQMHDSPQSSRRKVPRVDKQDGMSTHGKHILNDDTNLLASFTQFLGSEEEQKPQLQQQQQLLGDDLMGFGHHDKLRRVENYESMSIVQPNPNAHHLENSPFQDQVQFANLSTVDEICYRYVHNEAPADTLVASEPQPTNFYCAAIGNVFRYSELDDIVFREAYHPKQNNDAIAAAVEENQFDDGPWLDDIIEDNGSKYPAAK
ncbi:hypothetical protein ACLB2K_019902 [Fragaria x ananassa]